jgi:hypothetical protein
VYKRAPGRLTWTWRCFRVRVPLPPTVVDPGPVVIGDIKELGGTRYSSASALNARAKGRDESDRAGGYRISSRSTRATSKSAGCQRSGAPARWRR